MKKFLACQLIVFLMVHLAGCSIYAPNTPEPPQPEPGVNNTQEPSLEPQDSPDTEETEDKPPDPLTPVESPDDEVLTQSRSWYFQRNKLHQVPYVDPQIINMLDKYSSFYAIPNNEKKIYLTFDEGYELGYTGQILDILKENHVSAAFFITGHYLRSQPELVQRMADEGHLVCNHTNNHPDLGSISKEELVFEITSLASDYKKLVGKDMDPYLRPPSGKYSAQSLKFTQELGYTTVFWSMAFNDWDPNNQPGAEYSFNHVMENIHPGAVILLHAVSESNTGALDRMVKELKNQGYVFATFDQ
ncbi:MAG: delta-lactam-biosynthetic de-N-acetylase [Syntrophomonadaceae bacterium]